jgi:hypothetical protein
MPARVTRTPRTSWYWLRSSASAMRRSAASQRTVSRSSSVSAANARSLFRGRALPW